jgi:membrane protein DedA with SNARE-associated domain
MLNTLSANLKFRFLVKNGLRGLLWMAVLLAAYLLFDEIVVSKNPEAWIERFYSRPYLVYGIYLFSEFFFGLFPPELFMIWAINKSDLLHYVIHVSFFAVVSYIMGYLNFVIGQLLYKRVFFRYFRIKFLRTTWPLVRKYGLFLIIVAALTPLPWSAVSLLVGSSGFSTRKYLLYALFRILRFIVYGYIVFQTHQFSGA